MGFQICWDLDSIRRQIDAMLTEIRSPYNDGWTSSCCKHDLYKLKCFIEDEYAKLPAFVGEEKWEQERMVDVLKKVNK